MASNMTEILEECSLSAERGYEIAKTSYDEIHQALLEEEQKVNEANRRQNRIKRVANSTFLKKQKNNLAEFKQMDLILKNDLDLLYENLKNFSIVVYGRTEAGKSTLMETLIHGDGSSIGRGGQRTTRDVREYYWQNLKVIDVPGIAADDKEAEYTDDTLAIEAAKKADLVLFLITDDAPQLEEAKNLAILRDLGKPVLGIMNVKEKLNMNRRALAIRGLKKKLNDVTRLNNICEQFKAYAEQFNQNWQDIPFIYTHLRAAFLGQSSQLNDEELYELSNFSQVENFIINKVSEDGSFLRIKTFVDRAVVPMQKRMELLLEHSSNNVKQGNIYREKINELNKWTDRFVKKTQRKIDNFKEHLYQILNDEIFEFSKYNYQNERAGEAWNKAVQSLHLEQMCNDFLEDIHWDCEKKRRELADELYEEMNALSIDGIDAGDIEMETIVDTRSLFKYGGIGAALLISGPAGWIVGGAMGLLSFLFDDEDEKIRQQQEELRKKLHEVMDPEIPKIIDKIVDNINEFILGKEVDGLRNALDEMSNVFFKLALEEKNAAEYLNSKLFNLNADLWIEAGIEKEIEDKYCLNYMARVPGQIFYGIGTGNVSEKSCAILSELLGEKLIYISLPDEQDKSDTPKIWTIIEDWIGEWYDETIDFGEDEKIRLFKLIDNKPLQIMKNDINYRLAEQVRCQPLFVK